MLLNAQFFQKDFELQVSELGVVIYNEKLRDPISYQDVHVEEF